MKCINCKNSNDLNYFSLSGEGGKWICSSCKSDFYNREAADKFLETKEHDFYMNWVVGQDSPKFQFQDLKSAMKEAERLSGKEDESVYVLVPVKVVRVRKEIEWEDC